VNANSTGRPSYPNISSSIPANALTTARYAKSNVFLGRPTCIDTCGAARGRTGPLSFPRGVADPRRLLSPLPTHQTEHLLPRSQNPPHRTSQRARPYYCPIWGLIRAGDLFPLPRGNLSRLRLFLVSSNTPYLCRLPIAYIFLSYCQHLHPPPILHWMLSLPTQAGLRIVKSSLPGYHLYLVQEMSTGMLSLTMHNNLAPGPPFWCKQSCAHSMAESTLPGNTMSQPPSNSTFVYLVFIYL